MRWSFVFAAAAVAGLASPTARADDAMVHVGHNSLQPAEVSVSAGDTVTFHNMDEMPGGHTIVSDDGSLSSPPLAKGEAWSHQFQESGRVGFHIKEHSGAKMTVVVK